MHPSSVRIATVFTCFLAVAPAIADDVRVTLIDGTLRVAGDADGNRFILLQNEASDLIALGFPGTTVNGQPVVRIPGATIEDVRIDLGGGSDNLGIGGLQVGNDMIINGAEGNDTIFQSNLPIAVGRNLIIRLGGGGDGVSFDGLTVSGDLDLADPVGFQISDFRNTVVTGSVNILGSIDSDVLIFDQADIAGLLQIASPGGGSTFIDDSALGEVRLDFGTDEQSVARLDVVTVAGDVTITTGALVDSVDFVDSQVGGAVAVALGDGDDFIEGRNLQVTGTLLFDGGDGVDTLTDGGFEATGGETIINIEIIN
ncbi:MAG: hypothetical protein AAFX85_16505 [Pseudomonadota bacterium]